VAADNLCPGLTVVVDCVNPWPLTRDEWRAVAEQMGVPALEVEIVCRDETVHRRRVDSRVADIGGHRLSSWQRSWSQTIAHGTALGSSSIPPGRPCRRAWTRSSPDCRHSVHPILSDDRRSAVMPPHVRARVAKVVQTGRERSEVPLLGKLARQRRLSHQFRARVLPRHAFEPAARAALRATRSLSCVAAPRSIEITSYAVAEPRQATTRFPRGAFWPSPTPRRS
jgi:hypothetical protein